MATATHQPELGDRQGRRVSEQELKEAIRLHSIWLSDITAGQRCMFGGRDLSGLQFGVLGGAPIDLNGADFAGADLSGTDADDILVHHCNFNGARFDESRWRQPVYAFADMRRASAKRVKWGISDHRGSPARFLADFRHTALNGADLTEAQICGYFYGTQMGGASLLRTDLSHSDLLGPMHHGMSFAGAQLHGAKMCDCRLSSVSFFNADCAGADFSRAILSDVRMKGCVLTRARFREAEIERTMFSPDQMQQVDVRRRNVKSRNCVERPIKALSSCKEKRSNSNWKHCCAIDSLGRHYRARAERRIRG